MSWLTAAEALQVLGVRPQTLYANVSRKRIRAKPDPKDPRRSLYHDTDVRKLARQQGGRRKTSAVASGAIEWGDPLLSSAISTVVDGRLYYRGQDAVELASRRSFEEVVGLLWSSTEDLELSGGETSIIESQSPLQRAFLALGGRAGEDMSSYGRALPVLQAEAADVFATLAEALLVSATEGLLHERVARAWQRPRAADIVRRALVLLADHELNASTFATRVAVSTGAPLSAGVLSGLATLSGPLHGQAALGVLELIGAVERWGSAEKAVRGWLAQGRHIVGFGHPLYPGGDPRATALLAELDLPREYARLCEVVEQVIGEKPNIDFALAALSKVYRLPREAPLILFALARCAGWLAHALEQVTTGHPIRPRARYVGPPVVPVGGR